MNDERFFDLAMKVIARQCTDAERAELDALLAREPELKTEFERLQADVRTAKDALPLVDATQATAGEFPAYARGRLQTKVRETLGRPESAAKEPDRSLKWGWQWSVGLASVAALVVFLLIPSLSKSPQPIIQVAMLDTVGATRGTATNELAVLQQTWKELSIQDFSKASELDAWEKNLPVENKQRMAKIIYDRAAGEVRVSGRRDGKSFQKTFLVDRELVVVLQQAKAFVDEQMKR